jgi:hypothetical protein
MGLEKILYDEKFNVFFSFILGIGIICLVRPICTGTECNVDKAPAEKDFDKFVYRMSGGKCYEFKTDLVKCPVSGAIEAFMQCPSHKQSYINPRFAHRHSPIM